MIKRFLTKSLVKLSRKPRAKVSLEKLEGFVLDVGAGGEGTIARACGREIVCADVSKREIGEAKAEVRSPIGFYVMPALCLSEMALLT